MKTTTINLYKLNELPEDVQEKVISNWRYNDEFYNGQEIVESLKAFCDYFGIKLKDYSLGGRGEYIHIDSSLDPDIEDMEYIRLYKYLVNNYNLQDIADRCLISGMCYDYDLLKPLLDFTKRPVKGYNLDDLFKLCIESIISVYNEELDYWYSEESIKEDIEANDYDFTENGELYS